MNNNDPKNSIKKFLKKKIDIQERPPEYTEEFIKKKLIEEPRDYYDAQKSFWNRFKARMLNAPSKMFFFRKKVFKRFMNETFPMLTFLSFSCYIVYLMESKYSSMKDKIVASKSFKQLQVEQEDEEIRQALFNEGENPALKKTLLSEKTKKQKYKFEYYDDDEEDDEKLENSIKFTTEDDLLEKIYEDYLKGDKIPPQYVDIIKTYIKKKNTNSEENSPEKNENSPEKNEK